MELKERLNKALADMQSKVRFNEDGHTYKTTDEGVSLQGVSSVSSIVPKDWLSAWGAKEAVKFLGYSDYEGDVKRANEVMWQIWSLQSDLNEKKDGIRKSAVEKYIEILKEAKGASGRKSKTALVDGKAGHKWLEGYVKAKIDGTELPRVPLGSLKRSLNQFLGWETENISEWLVSECLVAYPEKKYAGTLDAVAILKDGRSAIVDFKFASHISEDFYLQLAGYQATFEPYNIKIDKRIIIRLPKTLEKEEWNDKEKKYEMVANNIEPFEVKTKYEWDRDVFFNALPVKSWCNQFKNY